MREDTLCGEARWFGREDRLFAVELRPADRFFAEVVHDVPSRGARNVPEATSLRIALSSLCPGPAFEFSHISTGQI